MVTKNKEIIKYLSNLDPKKREKLLNLSYKPEENKRKIIPLNRFLK